MLLFLVRCQDFFVFVCFLLNASELMAVLSALFSDGVYANLWQWWAQHYQILRYWSIKGDGNDVEGAIKSLKQINQNTCFLILRHVCIWTIAGENSWLIYAKVCLFNNECTAISIHSQLCPLYTQKKKKNHVPIQFICFYFYFYKYLNILTTRYSTIEIFEVRYDSKSFWCFPRLHYFVKKI